jgi:hypothetical protein
MGTKSWDVMCDEHGIGGGGDDCGDNDANLGRINVFHHLTTCFSRVATAIDSKSPKVHHRED